VNNLAAAGGGLLSETPVPLDDERIAAGRTGTCSCQPYDPAANDNRLKIHQQSTRLILILSL
jgi:hypothetical protein